MPYPYIACEYVANFIFQDSNGGRHDLALGTNNLQSGSPGGPYERLEQAEKTGAAFLVTDLEVAMTLIHIAGNAAEDSEKRIRNRANARLAYDAVSRITSHAVLTEDERQDVDEKLAELRSALQGLGEVFA